MINFLIFTLEGIAILVLFMLICYITGYFVTRGHYDAYKAEWRALDIKLVSCKCKEEEDKK